LVEMHLACQPAEIRPTLCVFSEKDGVVALSPFDLRSEDGPDAEMVACEGEAHHPIHPVMVGQGQGIHPQLGGALSQIAYMCGSFS
jgi:hypothetical protein